MIRTISISILKIWANSVFIPVSVPFYGIKKKEVLHTKIIHVIGPVGCGKSTFIRKYLHGYPVLDVKKIYEYTGIIPADMMDPYVYRRFTDILKYLFDEFEMFGDFQCEFYPEDNSAGGSGSDDILICESSGINKALNKLISRYESIRILVISDFHKRIYKSRPYAIELNKIIFRKIRNREFRTDTVYYANGDVFIGKIPADFTKYLRIKVHYK